MTVRQYIEESILILTISPVVEHFKVIKRRETETDGYLRGRAVLTDETLLEISMYCQRIEGAVRLIGYRFHWQDKEAKLLKRWDNAKHHPELKTFPYHPAPVLPNTPNELSRPDRPEETRQTT